MSEQGCDNHGRFSGWVHPHAAPRPLPGSVQSSWDIYVRTGRGRASGREGFNRSVFHGQVSLDAVAGHHGQFVHVGYEEQTLG